MGAKHPIYAASLNNLALLYLEMDKATKALEYSSAVLQALDGYLEDSFDHLSDLQRTQIILNVLKHLAFHLWLQEQTGQPGAMRRYPAVLNWKGCVGARGNLDRLLRDHPELQEPGERLHALRGRLTRLWMQTPGPKQHAAWLKRLQALADEKVRLEADLARRSADIRLHEQRLRLTSTQLSKELPADVAFIGFLQYEGKWKRVNRKWKW